MQYTHKTHTSIDASQFNWRDQICPAGMIIADALQHINTSNNTSNNMSINTSKNMSMNMNDRQCMLSIWYDMLRYDTISIERCIVLYDFNDSHVSKKILTTKQQFSNNTKYSLVFYMVAALDTPGGRLEIPIAASFVNSNATNACRSATDWRTIRWKQTWFNI